MGLFDSEARVSLREVEFFKESVVSFYNTIQSIKYEMLGNLKSEIEDIDTRAEAMKALATSAQSLYEQTKRLEADINATIRQLRAQLQSTPKEIEIKKTGQDGKVTVTKKPNPEYSRLVQEIKKQESRLARAKEVAWKVYNKVSEYRRNSEYLFSRSAELAKSAEEIRYSMQGIEQKTVSARNSLEATVDAINEYTKERLNY